VPSATGAPAQAIEAFGARIALEPLERT